MSTSGSVIPRASRLVDVGGELSKEAKQRLRRPTWSAALATAVHHVREQYPRWGKDKLMFLLRQDGWTVSTAMVGRIVTDLRRRGLLREPVRVATRRARRSVAPPMPCARRRIMWWPHRGTWCSSTPRSSTPNRASPCVTSAPATRSRAGMCAPSSAAPPPRSRDFLQDVLARMPFPVRAVPIDGGSEFKAEFEAACAEQNQRLFVLPPKSPKRNGRVERSHRTHADEFYQCYGGDPTIAALQPALRRWNSIPSRPSAPAAPDGAGAAGAAASSTRRTVLRLTTMSSRSASIAVKCCRWKAAYGPLPVSALCVPRCGSPRSSLQHS
jgi:hypothetical protein